MKIRDASDEDQYAIARMASRGDLLLDDLTEKNFQPMLRWLYADTAHDHRLQIVAEHEDNVVAHYGAVPFAYKLDGIACVGGFASNLVIDPKYRASMLFVSMQSYLQRQYREKGVRFLYGLVTRANVIEPHLRTGWKKVGIVPVFAKPFVFTNVVGPLIANHFLRSAARVPLNILGLGWRSFWAAGRSQIDEIDLFEPEIDDLLIQFMTSHRTTAIRTREVLNWRFRGNRDRSYRLFIARRQDRIEGYVVTRELQLKHLRAIAIVDLVCAPHANAIASQLLRHCDHLAIAAKVDVLAAVANPRLSLAKQLRRAGFFQTPESFTGVMHFPKSEPCPIAFPNLFEQWHVTWFDHDYV